MTATTSNDAEEAVRWDLADGSLQISCERDGSIWISSATPEGQTWIRVKAAQARGVSNLLWRFAAIADARAQPAMSRATSSIGQEGAASGSRERP